MPGTPPTTTPRGRIERCGCDRRARHRRFPSRSIAGSGVDRSWAASSTSTTRQLEPLVRPMAAFWNPTGCSTTPTLPTLSGSSASPHTRPSCPPPLGSTRPTTPRKLLSNYCSTVPQTGWQVPGTHRSVGLHRAAGV